MMPVKWRTYMYNELKNVELTETNIDIIEWAINSLMLSGILKEQEGNEAQQTLDTLEEQK
tara:strand:+ start:825 stop:1004 length:180 start_codon:yes stop_codon:yes gene_type:complete